MGNAAGHVPPAEFALLGGARAGHLEIAEQDERFRPLSHELSFDTPFGASPPVTHFELEPSPGLVRSALFARRHAIGDDEWATLTSQDLAQQSLALFWVLQRSGVQRIVAESGVASISQHFHPRDLVVPHDFIDFTPQYGGRLNPGAAVVMREPFCPDIREALWQRSRQFAAEKATRAFNRAVHASIEGPRRATAAEVTALTRFGGDIISQTLTPDIYLARELGACFGAVQMVLNYAEGVRPEWDFELLRAIVREGAEQLGQVALDALAALPDQPQCRCAGYLQPSRGMAPAATAN